MCGRKCIPDPGGPAPGGAFLNHSCALPRQDAVHLLVAHRCFGHFFCIYISLSNPDTPSCHLPITSIFSSYAKRKGYFEACVAGNGQLPRASPSEEPWRVPCTPLDISGTPAAEATCTDSSKQANKMLSYSESHPISLLLDIATLYILMKCVRLKIQNQIYSLTV